MRSSWLYFAMRSERDIAFLHFGVLVLLDLHLPVHVPHPQPPAFAQPERKLKQYDKDGEGRGE